MNTNPDTHCQACGEVLSEYGHCWQCHYPPMDPAQDANPQQHDMLNHTRYPEKIEDWEQDASNQ